MNFLSSKKRLFAIYVFFVLYGLALVVISRYFALAPWYLLLSFYFLVFYPGFSLSRIFKIEFIADKIGQFLLLMTLGLVYNFFICFLAIVFGWTLQTLIWVYLPLTILIFCLGLVLDFLRPKITQDDPLNYKLKDIFNKKNTPFLLLFVFVLAVLITIDEQGSNFKGDPYFHLVIMRKVLGGLPMSPENLNFIKTAQIHPAYGFPVWHTFLTMVAVLIKSNIFTVWAEISLPLSILVMVTWYWFCRKILPTRESAVLSFMLFIVFSYAYLDGYYFTRLPVPDTLCQFLILPLIFALSIKYIFDSRVSYKVLVAFSLLSLLMAAIHFTQYFYFLIVMVVFALVYALAKFRDDQFKTTFKRILLTIFTNIIMVLPFVALLEYHGKVVSLTVKIFWNSEAYKQRFNKHSFAGGEIFAKYAYLATPLILVFVKKYQKLIFLFSLFIIVPLIYSRTIVFIQYYLIRLLGMIFFNRIYINITWPHLVWGLFLGFFMVLFDRLVSKITLFSKVARIGLDFVLFSFGIWLILIEQKQGLVSSFLKETVTSKKTFIYLNNYYYWFFGGVVILTLIILIVQKYFKKTIHFFRYEELKNQSTALIITFLIIFFLFSPNFKNLLHLINLEFTQKYFFITSRDHTSAAVNPATVGGWETVDYIRKNIPAKSVFLTDKSALTTLPMLIDQYMVTYPRAPEEKFYQKIYNNNIEIEKKIKYLTYSKVEYIFLTYPEKEGEAYFDQYPQYFTKIYCDSVAIFKVDTQKVNYDYQKLVQEGEINPDLDE